MKAAVKKKTVSKKTAAKKAVPAKSASPARKAAPGTVPTEPIQKQPQSKQQAAVQAGLFLHTDDQWSQAYFNSGDLHCEERELFG